MSFQLDVTTRIIQLERKVDELSTLEIPGNFTPGGILFANASGLIAQDPLFYWDDTNNRLGIQTTAPSGYLHIKFTGGSKIGLEIEDNSASADTLIKLINPTNEIASGSYFIRAIKGSTDQFYVRGDGAGYFLGSLQVDSTSTFNGAVAMTTHNNTIAFTGGSRIGLKISDSTPSSDTLFQLDDANGNNIGSGSYFIQALKGSTQQFYVRGDGAGYFAGALTADGDFTTNAVNRFIIEDAGTTTQITPLSLYHRSTGTPGVNFGVNFNLNLESTSGADRNAGTVQALWTVATDASRTSQMRFYAYDATTFREFFRGGSSGSAPQIGFFGGAAASKQNVSGSKAGNAALTSLMAALSAYGLVTDSTT